MKKAYNVNGNFNGSSCEDAIIVFASNRKEAETEASKWGVTPYVIELIKDSELTNREVVQIKTPYGVHLERYIFIGAYGYPESWLD